MSKESIHIILEFWKVLQRWAISSSSKHCSRFVYMLLGLIWITPNCLLLAQNQGTTALSFIEVPAGARSIAMGEAYVAVVDDHSALYWNPAGMTRVSGNQSGFQYTEWFVDTQLSYASAVIGLDKGFIGAHLYLFDGGLMDVTTLYYPEGTGEQFSVQDISLGLSYARALTDKFSMGGTLKLVQSRIWRMRASSLALDLGFQYQTPLERLKLGFSITNFGSEMRLDGDNTFVRIDQDPQTAGDNDGIPANLYIKSWDLPLIFRIGFDYYMIETLDHSVRIATDAVYPNNNSNYVNMGMEYGYRDMVFIRSGYAHLFLTDNYGQGHFRTGIGLQLSNKLQFDFSYSERGDLGSVNTLGLSVNF